MSGMTKLNISTGNRKMGAIPSFSLPSGITCSAEACATCYLDGCYGKAMEARLANVRNSYAENFSALLGDIEGCKKYLNWYFDNPNAPRMFRIHVVGDFFSCEYFNMWLDVIRSHPETKFMAFTKQFDVIRLAVYAKRIPENFSLIASAWPGVELPPWIEKNMPVAYMQDGTEKRVTEATHLCDGDCAGNCNGHCWKMQKGESVVFEKHGPNARKNKKEDK